MVQFIQVDPANIPDKRMGRRGRVSYPLLKSFLEANMKCVKVDLTGYNRNPTYLRSVLTSYIKSKQLPIKLFAAEGDLHLLRLDMDDEGNIDPNWKCEEVTTEGNLGLMRNTVPLPITPQEVQNRFNVEAGQITK